MAGKVLATDLDGTLFYPKKIKRCIPKKNVKFLRKWIDSGNKLVLISSRSSKFIKTLQGEIKRPFDFVSCSSAQIYSNGELIRDITIDNEKLKNIINDIDKKFSPLAYIMTTENHPIVIKLGKKIGPFFQLFYHLWYKLQFKYKEEYVCSDKVFDEELENGKIYKILLVFGLRKANNKLSKELNKEIRSLYPDIESAWSGISIEITPKDVNKAAGLSYYAKHNRIDESNIYVVGDSGNDISMFQRFYENSYCMFKAYTSVRKYAKHTISRVYDLEKLLLKGEKNNE